MRRRATPRATRAHVTACLAALLFGASLPVACTPSSPAREERAAPRTARGPQAAAEPTASPVAAEASAPNGPPPAVVVAAEVDDRGVVPVVQNHDHAVVTLATALVVEREGAQGFEPFVRDGLALRDDCAAAPVSCRELVPGAELRPPPWRPSAGRAQCGDAASPTTKDGRYRFVARTCDGARIEGAPFELR